MGANARHPERRTRPGHPRRARLLTCDHQLFDPRLRALPPVFVVRPPEGPARDWVRASISYAAQQTALVADDRFEAPTRIPELLLVEVLKLHLATTPAEETGWLHALRDPVLASAFAWRMHAAKDLLRSSDPRRGSRGPSGRLRFGGGLQSRLRTRDRTGPQPGGSPADRQNLDLRADGQGFTRTGLDERHRLDDCGLQLAVYARHRAMGRLTKAERARPTKGAK